MPTSLTRDQQYEHFLKLPEPLKDAISSVNTADIIFAVGKAHKLSIDKIGILGQETGLVMSGISPAKEYIHTLIAGLGVSQEEANLIGREVSEKIFLPIREYMKEFHGGEWEKDLPREPFDTAQGKQRVENKEQVQGVRDQVLGVGGGGTSGQALGKSGGTRNEVLGTRTSEQRTMNSEQKPVPPPPTQPKPEPLIINPLGRSTEPVPSIKYPLSNPTDPQTQAPKFVPSQEPARQAIQTPEKELSAPIINPIIKGSSNTSNALPKPSSSIPTAIPTPTPPREIPEYYQQVKKDAEKELAELQMKGNGEKGTVPQGASNQALGMNGEQAKVSLPTGPSPYIISVNREPFDAAQGKQRIENREQVQGTRDQALQPSSGQALGTRTNEPSDAPIPTMITPPSKPPPAPSTPPIISVTPPRAAGGARDEALAANGGTRIEHRAQGIETSQNTPSVPNPIRIEKKIPKPPAPEKYESDPYKEPIE